MTSAEAFLAQVRSEHADNTFMWACQSCNEQWPCPTERLARFTEAVLDWDAHLPEIATMARLHLGGDK